MEVIALNSLCNVFSDYSWDMFQLFSKAHDLVQAGSLYHHLSYVDEYLTYTSRQETIKRLATARDKARRAWNLTYGSNDNHEEAVRIWRQIFGDEFPAYG